MVSHAEICGLMGELTACHDDGKYLLPISSMEQIEYVESRFYERSSLSETRCFRMVSLVQKFEHRHLVTRVYPPIAIQIDVLKERQTFLDSSLHRLKRSPAAWRLPTERLASSYVV